MSSEALRLTTPVSAAFLDSGGARCLVGRITGRCFKDGEWLYDVTPANGGKPLLNVKLGDMEVRGSARDDVLKLLPERPKAASAVESAGDDGQGADEAFYDWRSGSLGAFMALRVPPPLALGAFLAGALVVGGILTLGLR